MTIQHTNRHIPIRGICISLNDVRLIATRLIKILNRNADTLIAQAQRLENQTEEEFANRMIEARERAFKITVTIKGKDGESVIGEAPEIFESANLPEPILQIFMTNNAAYYNYARVDNPNRFNLLFDFGKPPLLDAVNSISAPTSNNSHLSVDSSNDAFISEVTEKVLSVVSKRRIIRFGLHEGFAYDALLWFVGMPISIWFCYRLSPVVSGTLKGISPVLEGIAYAWLLFFFIVCFRIFFGYSKWAFPSVELKQDDSKTKIHRGFWYAILISLIGAGLYDFIT